MTNNVLIFRTDRIGDLLITCPAILTIKKNVSNSKITLVTSKKNYQYAKTFEIFDEIYQFPEKNIIKVIKFIYNISKIKFDYIFIFDGKERSILSSLFIKSKNKVATISGKKLKLIYKLFNIDFIVDTDTNNLINLYQKSIFHCKINANISNFDFIKDKKDNNFSKEIKIKDFFHIHLNEKWFKNLYIKNYSEINPTYEDFVYFINTLSEKNNILISTGLINFELLDLLKNKFFKKKNEKIYYKTTKIGFIYLIYKPSLLDLESLLRKSKVLVLCHSGIIHAASSLNIKIIDILEEKYFSWYKRWVSHIKYYKIIYRCNFSVMKTKLITDITNSN